MTRTLCLLTLLCAATPGLCGENATEYVKRFEKTYRKAKTLQATFLEQYSQGGRMVRSEAGTAYFRRPGQMRWEYGEPETNLFVVDGKTAWFYVPADHTVTRVPAKQSEDWRTPLALLAGQMKVSRICSRVEVDETAPSGDKGLVLLRCALRGPGKPAATPAEQALTPTAIPELVEFELERATGNLRRVIVHDRAGVRVEFRFANWVFDPPIGAQSFRFDPPKGVAIVSGEMDSSAGEGEKR